MVKILPAAYHIILQKATGLFLDGNAEGKVYLLKGNGGDFQKWQITNKPDGTYNLLQKATNRFLDINKNGQFFTAKINNENVHKWEIMGLEDGTFLIKSIENKFILDSKIDGNVCTSDEVDKPTDNRRWIIVPVTGSEGLVLPGQWDSSEN